MVKLARDPKVRNAVIQCMVMRLPEKEALSFLNRQGIEIHEATYYRLKNKILANRFKRIKEIFDHEFIDEYIQAIDTMKDCESKLYECYRQEEDWSKKADILVQIISIKPMLVEFYHNTKKVIQKNKATEIQEASFS